MNYGKEQGLSLEDILIFLMRHLVSMYNFNSMQTSLEASCQFGEFEIIIKLNIFAKQCIVYFQCK